MAHSGNQEPANPNGASVGVQIPAYQMNVYLVRELGRVDSRVRNRTAVLPVSPPVLHAIRDREHNRSERSDELQRTCDGKPFSINVTEAASA